MAFSYSNNNLSKWRLGHSSNYFLVGNDTSGSKLYLATGQNYNDFYQLYADEDYLRFGKQSGGNWTECWRAALKSDLNSALIYRGDITGDLNRASKNGITPGYYTVRNSSTISNGPKGIAWCTFIQFYDNFYTQMIIDTTGLFVRKFAGNPAEWIDWVQYSKS